MNKRNNSVLFATTVDDLKLKVYVNDNGDTRCLKFYCDKTLIDSMNVEAPIKTVENINSKVLDLQVYDQYDETPLGTVCFVLECHAYARR